MKKRNGNILEVRFFKYKWKIQNSMYQFNLGAIIKVLMKSSIFIIHGKAFDLLFSIFIVHKIQYPETSGLWGPDLHLA